MECHSNKLPARKEQLAGGQRFVGVRSLFLILLMLGAVSSAWGADPIPNPESGTQVLDLKPIPELNQNNSDFVIVKATGKANTDDYPVSFLLATDQGKCTWFLVGPRTLMTAAHCVSEGASIRIKNKDKAETYKGHCDQAPGYKKDPSQDWALCRLEADYLLPISGTKPPSFYEVINTDPSALQKRKKIQITGFGCTNPPKGPLDGIYRVGEVEIDGLPGELLLPRTRIEAPNYFTTEALPSYLCEGDSGGPAFDLDDATPLYRRVIGINSRSSYAMKVGTGYLASTSTEAALAFFTKWANDHQQKICGLHKDAENCRPPRP